MRLRAGLLAAVALAASLSTAGTASADGPDEVDLVVGAAALAEQRQSAMQERRAGREPGEVARARAQFTGDAASRGATYTDDEVEAFRASDGVILALPKAAKVRSLTVRKQGKEIQASADIVVEDDAAPAHQGLGMASWSTGTSGCYTITISGAARMQTCWYKKKMLDDADGLYDYYSYQRKAWGQADDIYGVDWSITGMRVRSYPTSSTAGNFKGVISRKPGSDFTGNCDTLPFSLSISYKGASTGLSFTDCDSYDVSFGAVFGDYSNYFSQGAVFSRGNREVAYHEVTKVAQGASAVWNDYQRLEIARWSYPAKTCSSTNGNATCSP